MGTWGTGLFSNDFALDIKGEFTDKIADGISPADATAELMHAYKDDLDDPDESCVFWFALAATQWKLGRLQDNVKQKAIELIDMGEDPERWIENKTDYQKRKTVLSKLKDQLLSEQPPAKKVAKPFICDTNMEIGDLLSYRCTNGNFAIIRVVHIQQEYYGSRYPQVEILDYFNSRVPDLKTIKKLGRKIIKHEETNYYYLIPKGKRDQEPWDKLTVLERTKKEPDAKFQRESALLFWWKDFEMRLEELFDV